MSIKYLHQNSNRPSSAEQRGALLKLGEIRIYSYSVFNILDGGPSVFTSENWATSLQIYYYTRPGLDSVIGSILTPLV